MGRDRRYENIGALKKYFGIDAPVRLFCLRDSFLQKESPCFGTIRCIGIEVSQSSVTQNEPRAHVLTHQVEFLLDSKFATEVVGQPRRAPCFRRVESLELGMGGGGAQGAVTAKLLVTSTSAHAHD